MLFVLVLNAAVLHAEEPPNPRQCPIPDDGGKPNLRVFDVRLQGLEGNRLTANLSPAYEAGLEVENLFGSGNLQGIDGAEYTLSSVIELGGKRQARTVVANSSYDQTEAERKAGTLWVLSEVTQGFVATPAVQAKLALATEALELSEATFNGVTNRASQGATSDAEVRVPSVSAH